MDYTLITQLEALLGVKGYIEVKAESTPYPAFVVSVDTGRGEDIHGNGGRSYDMRHDVQVNIIGTTYHSIRALRETLIETLDGYSGAFGEYQIIDCRLQDTGTTRNTNKHYEIVVLFTMNTLREV